MATVTLRVIEGPQSGRVFTYDEPARTLIGRALDCGVRAPGDDPRISERHCVLEINPPGVEIRDLGSVAGMLINGVKVGGTMSGIGTPSLPIALGHGDQIAIGSWVLSCETSGVPQAVIDVVEPEDAELDAAAAEIAGYAQVRVLSRGGMGAVYLVRREADGAQLVVKMMLANLAANARAQAMFQREIELTRTLAHPNIVAVHEDGIVGRFRYFVMEYCAGGSAQDLLSANGGKLGAHHAVPIVLQALAGLAHAHDKGVVHRDIKPANILLSTPAGEGARLTDFGLAKSFELDATSFTITSTGMMAGTPDFMPREQLIDYRGVRPPGDVWAMGATLYSLITGLAARADAPSKDPIATILVNPIVPIRSRAPEVSARLAAVIERALADDVAHRFADGGAMHDALLASTLEGCRSTGAGFSS